MKTKKQKTTCSDMKAPEMCCCRTTIEKCNITKKGKCNNDKSIRNWT